MPLGMVLMILVVASATSCCRGGLSDNKNMPRRTAPASRGTGKLLYAKGKAFCPAARPP